MTCLKVLDGVPDDEVRFRILSLIARPDRTEQPGEVRKTFRLGQMRINGITSL